jgi:hypothetical protein
VRERLLGPSLVALANTPGHKVFTDMLTELVGRRQHR